MKEDLLLSSVSIQVIIIGSGQSLVGVVDSHKSLLETVENKHLSLVMKFIKSIASPFITDESDVVPLSLPL